MVWSLSVWDWVGRIRWHCWVRWSTVRFSHFVAIGWRSTWRWWQTTIIWQKYTISDFGSLLPTSHCSMCVLISRSLMSSSLYSLLSSNEFQHFSIVFLQLFSAEVFQDVAERTVSISLSNDMNAVGSAGIAVFRLNLVWRVKISWCVVG